MSITTLFLVLAYCFTVIAKTEDTKQSKRGIPESSGWIGISNSHGHAHGHPYLSDPNWKRHEYPPFDLAPEGYDGEAGPGTPFRVTEPHYVQTIPMYITKHVVLERPVPVQQAVYIEKSYHVPVEKVVPVPVERIIHKPVPVPVPVAQAVPVLVNRVIPVPIKHPMSVPVQQTIPVPVPVPVPVPLHMPLNGIIGSGPVGATVYYVTGYGNDHFHLRTAGNYVYIREDGADYESDHSYGHGQGHGFGYDNDHGHGRNYGHTTSNNFQIYDHEQAMNKRSRD